MSFAEFGRNFRAQKVDVHKFSMVPHHEVPRSTFIKQSQHKTTFNAQELIPIFLEEVLPGDTFSVNMTAYCRLATTLYPIMDQMDIESWFFFVPNRIVWQHWVNFMGEQPSTPTDSISYTIPQVVSPAGGFVAFSIYDYFGCATAGQITGANTVSVSALPFRCYNLIWSQWFRDQNLQNALGTGATNTVGDIGDGPDPATNYNLIGVGKRHDYFTSCLPWTQKGGVAITTPLSGQATVKTAASNLYTGTQNPMTILEQGGGSVPALSPTGAISPNTGNVWGISTGSPGTIGGTPWTGVYPANLYADLSTATSATINQLRLAFQTQRLLERDARSGTRYQELVYSHFKVMGHDSRYQRPEYLGGGKSPVNIIPVPQTSAPGITGTTTPVGQLGGVGTAIAHNHGFRGSFTEHGHILGLIAVRRDQVYQQGTRRLWTRQTRYDFYWPVFANLGEQGVRNDEIYTQGTAADSQIFGYNEHWAEYRYMPSMCTGAFRSTYATPLDTWHLATKFTALPVLNSAFIIDDTAQSVARVIAVGPQGANEQFLADFFFNIKCARPMPLYSVPGMIDHF